MQRSGRRRRDSPCAPVSAGGPRFEVSHRQESRVERARELSARAPGAVQPCTDARADAAPLMPACPFGFESIAFFGLTASSPPSMFHVKHRHRGSLAARSEHAVGILRLGGAWTPAQHKRAARSHERSRAIALRVAHGHGQPSPAAVRAVRPYSGCVERLRGDHVGDCVPGSVVRSFYV